ncbi:hypothetical protein [Candidatus Borrarchaeum sp.]|uniref:hypothetical protein n=1 Tax=Candidatus Borrarchaeum sp. TaxID=2846742 RepID=UPI00257C45BA|nr:hypothetical protein [Candidatus Borrarchaeum sp.]
MQIKIFFYALGIWVLLLFLAISNALIRESVYAPIVGSYGGHVISTIIAILYTLIITYLFVVYLRADVTRIDLLLIGAFWLIITILFEFSFGHYVMGHPWSYLFADYNILKGRVWSVYLFVVFTAPSLWGFFLGV